MLENIPEVRIGLIAVSRDCFPIALSEKRRKNIAECLKDIDFAEVKTTVENDSEWRGR